MELLDQQNTTSRKQIDLKKEIAKYLRLWPYILGSVFIFYIGAKIYLRYAQPQYLSKTTLMIQKAKQSNNSAALSDLKTLGVGVTGDEELQGETTMVVAKPILARVVQKLNLQVTFFSQGKVKDIELYQDSPIEGIVVDNNDSDFGVKSIVIDKHDNNRFVIIEGSGKGKVFAFGQPFNIGFGDLILNQKKGRQLSSITKVVFKSLSVAVSNLEASVNVSLPPNKGLLMELSMTGPLPKKSENILNELTKQYNLEGISDKNLEAQNTQDFINERLDIITDDLNGIEGEKEGFKKQYQITDLDTQAGLAVTNSKENQKRLIQLSTQLEMTNSILRATQQDRLLPVNIGLTPALEANIASYNALWLSKNKTSQQATSANPALQQLSQQLSEIKDLIKQNLKESQASINVQLAQLQGQLSVDQKTINQYPTQEKIFRSIERQRNLKEQLYLYLLQKREENAINLAVTSPKSKVINPAFTIGKVQPNNGMINNAALALGLVLPLLVFFVKEFLDTKVRSKVQIQQALPNTDLLGEIPYQKDEYPSVSNQDNTFYTESFRILVSNLKFVLNTKQKENGSVILVTSSVQGEGKTTIAMNTALTLANSGKTIIIGADIRNPQLQQFMQVSNEGLSDYLVSKSQDISNFISTTPSHHNLDIISSGSKAPNPVDLLEMDKMKKLLEDLRHTYDYIIIDSAPLMVVSDTRSLLPNVDTVLYVVKAGLTDATILNFINDWKRSYNGTLNIVLNAVKMTESSYHAKYGYGYYTKEVKTSILRKVFKKI